MHRMTVALYLLLFLHCLTSVDLQEVAGVITDSSPCSVTCGLGVKTQTVCLLKDADTAVEEDAVSKGGAEVSQDCRVRKVKCQELWQCGLKTVTVTAGQRVKMDCLGEVMEAMGRFNWRVSWGRARGVITSDDSLFTRWKAPLLDRVLLDPVREEDAGSYRCDVQDISLRRVKRVYWGVRVLPVDVIDLDYERSEGRWWNSTGNQKTKTTTVMTGVLSTVLISVSVAAVGAALILLGVYWTVKRMKNLTIQS